MLGRLVDLLGPYQAAGAFAKTLASAAHNRDTETLISALAPQNKGAREWFEERYAHIDLPKTEKGTAQAIRDWVAKNPKREPFLLHETKAGDKMMFQDMKGNREFYEVIDPDKRGMAKVRNLETGQVKDWNSGTNDFYHATPEELAGIKPPTVPPTETTTKGAPTLQVFRSGATSITDLQAYARAGAPIGIVAGNLSAEGLKTVVEHNAKGGHLFVDRRHPDPTGILRRWRALVSEGLSLLIYAEGTRSPDGHVARFKAGSFLLAMQAGLPIVPIAVIGTRESMPKGRLETRPADVTLIIHDPIQPPAIDAPTPRDAKALAERVHAIVSAAVERRQFKTV
jgi:hypothetical protein